MQLKVTDSGIDQALENDARQPPLAYTFTWHGLTEHFELECNEPATGGMPALFVGETFVRVHKRDGANYRRGNSKALVRRAALDERPHGKHTMYFLALPYPGDNPLLVHVKTAPPAHYKKFRHKMWVGVRTDAAIKLEHKDEEVPDRQEYLLSFNDKKTADIFLADGRVVRLRRDGNQLKVECHPIEWQAAQRVGFADKLLKSGDRGKQTFAQFQLIAVLELAGARSERVFNSLYGVLAKAAKKLLLEKRVLQRFLEILQQRRPDLAKELDKELMVAKLSMLGTVKS